MEILSCWIEFSRFGARFVKNESMIKNRSWKSKIERHFFLSLWLGLGWLALQRGVRGVSALPRAAMCQEHQMPKNIFFELESGEQKSTLDEFLLIFERNWMIFSSTDRKFVWL